jgi:hypothetical protein
MSRTYTLKQMQKLAEGQGQAPSVAHANEIKRAFRQCITELDELRKAVEADEHEDSERYLALTILVFDFLNDPHQLNRSNLVDAIYDKPGWMSKVEEEAPRFWDDKSANVQRGEVKHAEGSDLRPTIRKDS